MYSLKKGPVDCRIGCVFCISERFIKSPEALANALYSELQARRSRSPEGDTAPISVIEPSVPSRFLV